MIDTKIEDHFPNELSFQPLSTDNWDAFVSLFGTNGAGSGCWCMYFRQTKAKHDEGKTTCANQERMHSLVQNNHPTGLMAFYGDTPVAWCALSPRDDFKRLAKSRVHKPIDSNKVWSIPCTFVSKKFRKRGVSVKLLKGAVDYAKKLGIEILEAYPTIPTTNSIPDGFAWIGLYKSFERAGFEIVDQKSKNRPMVRFYTKSS